MLPFFAPQINVNEVKKMEKIKFLEECYGGGKYKYRYFEITEEEAQVWIEGDYQYRLKHAPESQRANIQRRTCQEIQDEENRKFRNDYDRHSEHLVYGLTIKDKDGNEVDFLDMVPDPSPTPDELYRIEEERQESQAKVDAFLNTLTETQRRRVLMLEDGMSIAEIARAEGAAFNSIKESIESIKKKYQKFFN